jgi:sugar transferase (PEP-CTERM/EpsH1 system associated)
MLNILFITPRFPYPPIKGDQAIAYHRIRILSKKYNITLVSLYEHDNDLLYYKTLEPYCKDIHVIKLPKWESLFNVVFNGALSSIPLQVLYYKSGILVNCIRKLIGHNKYDIIHAYMLRMAPYLIRIPGIKLLELIDSMQLNIRRRLCLERYPEKIVYNEELRRLVKYERNIGNFVNHITMVSNIDRSYIDSDNVSIIPLGVDVEAFKPSAEQSKGPNIVFTGNMGYSPNICAVKWFAVKCMPIIRRHVPMAKLIIAGARPGKDVVELEECGGVEVVGYVPSVSNVISNAKVSVAPMLSGSGMQFKILEAMACGIPVVTTTVGLGDIKAVRGEHLCVADNEIDMAKEVVKLLRSNDMCRDMGMRAREYILKNHSWDTLTNMVDELYCRLMVS